MSKETKKVGYFRRAFGLTEAQLFGSLRERVTSLKKTTDLRRLKQAESKMNLSGSAHDKWQQACAIKGLNAEDIDYCEKVAKMRLFVNALASISFLVYFFNSVNNSASFLVLPMIGLAVALALIGFVSAWFRLSQIKDRALYSFKHWLTAK